MVPGTTVTRLNVGYEYNPIRSKQGFYGRP
jgi:hypothetical protein